MFQIYFFTVITNQVNLTNINILSATFETNSQESVNIVNASNHLTTPEDYEKNIFKMKYTHQLSFDLGLDAPLIIKK